jgi:hypothetical protein
MACCVDPTASHGFVTKVCEILPSGLKDSWTVAERGNPISSPVSAEEIDVSHTSTTVPGVWYGGQEKATKYTFTTFSFNAFRQVRLHFGIADAEFQRSLCTHRSVRCAIVGEVRAASRDYPSIGRRSHCARVCCDDRRRRALPSPFSSPATANSLSSSLLARSTIFC